MSEAVEMLRDLLRNRSCSCGGWKCTRCKLAVEESEQIIRQFDKDCTTSRHFQQPIAGTQLRQNIGVTPHGWQEP